MAQGLTLALRRGSELDEIIPFGETELKSNVDWVFQVKDPSQQWVTVKEVPYINATFEDVAINKLKWNAGTVEIENTSGSGVTYISWRLVLDGPDYADPAVVIPEREFDVAFESTVFVADGQKLVFEEITLEVVS